MTNAELEQLVEQLSAKIDDLAKAIGERLSALENAPDLTERVTALENAPAPVTADALPADHPHSTNARLVELERRAGVVLETLPDNVRGQ